MRAMDKIGTTKNFWKGFMNEEKQFKNLILEGWIWLTVLLMGGEKYMNTNIKSVCTIHTDFKKSVKITT